MPLLVVLILTLELIEVELEAVGLEGRTAKVSLHAEVEAGLEAGTSLILVVIEVLVEVGHRIVV